MSDDNASRVRLRSVRKALNEYFHDDPSVDDAKSDLLKLRRDIEIMLMMIEIGFAHQEFPQ